MTDEVEVFAVAHPGKPAYWHRPLDEAEILRHLDLIERMERLQQEMRKETCADRVD